MEPTSATGLASALVVSFLFVLVIFSNGPSTDTSSIAVETHSIGAFTVGTVEDHRTAMEQLKQAKIIGDVIDPFVQSVDMKVLYGSREVANEVELTPTQAASHPVVEIHGKKGMLYTLLMVDPDAPSPDAPAFREWLHWMVVDIPGGIPAENTVPPAGKEVVQYNGPTPPLGLHRYVLVLFAQEEAISRTVPAVIARKSFHTREFAKEMKLGLPVAALFFLAQPEGKR
eukprot:jgi/Mesen1/665/ME000109S10883